MKNNHCVSPCLRKYHKLGCIFFMKNIHQNLVPRSKSDTEIINLVKRAWKRKSLRHTDTLISRYNTPLSLFNYRYAKRNHNLFLYPSTIDKKERAKYLAIDGSDIRNDDAYRVINTVRNHSVSFCNSKRKFSFKKIINPIKCIHRKVKKNKQKKLKSTEENTFKEKCLVQTPTSLIDPQITLVSAIKSISNFHDHSLLLNDKKMEEKISYISIISNRNDIVSNPKNDSLLSKKWLPMEDDIVSLIKNSLRTYMIDNAAFFENNIRSTFIYESVGELDREKSKDSVLQTHDENTFMPKDGSGKVYLESLWECANIFNEKLSGSLNHKDINQEKKQEIFISKNFKNHSEKGRHFSNNHNPKKSEINNSSGIRRNHMCSKRCFSLGTSNQNMGINKGSELRYKKICDELKSGKIIMKMEETGILRKKRNNKMCFTYDMNKNSTSTLVKKNINSPKNNLIINNLINFNLIKQMKNMKVLKSFSDSCVDLEKTSKFCCIKSRKNNLNYSFHNCNHGTTLMETSTPLLNKNEISIKKVDFPKHNSTNYCSNNKVYYNHLNDWYQLEKTGKSYSNDSIKKPGMLKTYQQGKNLLEKCGDTEIVTKSNNCSKSEMSYVIHSCDGDKYTQQYEPKHVYDDNQYCFADPDLYYCDSELYLDNELANSDRCSPELKVSSNYEILEYDGSTQSLNEGKEKLNLYEEVFESHKGKVDAKDFQKKKCSLKLAKTKKHVSRKNILKDENTEHWVHGIEKTQSGQNIISDSGLKQNQKKKSELSILSDFGLNCSSYVSNVSNLSGQRPHTATETRDAAVSAVRSNECLLKPSRSTIDKAIMCDEMVKNEHKHIMQLHRNNIIFESSEVIQLNGNSTSNYHSKDREPSTNISPTTEKFLKLELYQGESQTKYLEWHCNKVSNRSSDHSQETSHAEFANISSDELFRQREKNHKSKELEELEFKNNFEYLCNEENHSTQSKNIWTSLKTGSQKVFSFFQPIGPLRTCFKKNMF